MDFTPVPSSQNEARQADDGYDDVLLAEPLTRQQENPVFPGRVKPYRAPPRPPRGAKARRGDGGGSTPRSACTGRDSLGPPVTVMSADGEVRTKSITVARPEGKKLHFVEPKLVSPKHRAYWD